MAVNVEKLKSLTPPLGMDFHINKIGHVVLQVSDLERSTEFYTQVLGFKVSDVYPDEMMPAAWFFCVAIPIITAWRWWVPETEKTRTGSCIILRLKFPPSRKFCMLAIVYDNAGRRSISKVVVAPAVRSRWNFAIRTITHWKFIGEWIRSGATVGCAREMSGMASNLSRKQSPIRCRDRILTFQSDLIREYASANLFSRNWPNVIRCRGEESRARSYFVQD